MIYFDDKEIIIPKGISYNSFEASQFLSDISAALQEKGVSVPEKITYSDIANLIRSI